MSGLTQLPKIGTEWKGQGGIYAGMVRGEGAEPDYHLIIGPERETETPWAGATKWAKGLKEHGLSDYQLPSRAEQSLCYANLKHLFKPEWYWSREQHASSGPVAWCQLFVDGYQNTCLKVIICRARAVRRLVIQAFINLPGVAA